MLGWLADEPDKVPELRPVMKAAASGEVLILTSALAFIEVVWLKPNPKLNPQKEKKIRDFFKHSWIVVTDVDRKTGELARELVWKYSVRPKDAVYVATALLRHADCLDTFDESLITLSGKVGGDPPLMIARPRIPEQLALGLVGQRDLEATASGSSETQPSPDPEPESDI